MKTKIISAFIALFSIGAIFSTASADHIKAGDVMIKDPWARASASKKAKSAAAFFTLQNMGADDILLEVKSDLAKKTQIHKSGMDANGVMTMEQQDNLPLPAGEIVMLKPGSFHVMFMKLNAPFEIGKNITLELVFEKAGTVSVEVPVLKIGAMGADHSSH